LGGGGWREAPTGEMVRVFRRVPAVLGVQRCAWFGFRSWGSTAGELYGTEWFTPGFCVAVVGGFRGPCCFPVREHRKGGRAEVRGFPCGVPEVQEGSRPGFVVQSPLGFGGLEAGVQGVLPFKVQRVLCRVQGVLQGARGRGSNGVIV